jgi:hypothetical protein
MTTTNRSIHFEEHGGFHRAALHMSVAGGMAGLAAHVLSLIEPRLGGAAAALPMAIVAGAALRGAAPAEARSRAGDLPLVVVGASVAGAALTAGARGHLPSWAALAIFAVALGLVIARGLRGPRLWAAAAAGAAAALLARFVMGAVAAEDLGPAWMESALAGASFGGVALLGVLARHIVVFRRPASEVGEVDEVLTRARAALAASERAGDEPLVRETIRAEVARLAEVASRWQEMERRVASSPRRDDLIARLSDLDRRILSTNDQLAREQFEKAQGEVAQQLRDLESIDNARERVLARMHHTLAAIERRRLGAAGAEADCASHALIEAEEIMHAVADGRPIAGPPAP